MPPVISIVGNSNSGKTTLMEKLIVELGARGYRVATVKHVPEDTDLDKEGTDSWRHIRAGSQATAVSSPDQVALIKPVKEEASLDSVVQLFGEEYDIVLAEGFKHDSAPKIEVRRREAGPPLEGLNKLMAVVTDETADTAVRHIAPDDVTGITDLIEEGFIKPQAERLTLYINNENVQLSAFPREFIMNIILSIAASLKGVGKVKNLSLFMRKKD